MEAIAQSSCNCIEVTSCSRQAMPHDEGLIAARSPLHVVKFVALDCRVL